ncbi:MAG: hypothetical protein P4L85_22210 [Paludisphaera borealis]|uniref:hypothetical protein n=1 Tax=Paludisphaera borealis TaxID=1387353 RepID=UPI00283B023D|nr:hypothetical protein [Paludisphaera borealis]MDR3622080.1 hypothetical protein [Paludisphaera borealis]
MDESKRKLVVLFCMHRSGSSLTANVLQKLGMSLGPFELLGAAPSNPYGHFEPVPFLELNRKIQTWAFGFQEEGTEDPELLARFVDSQGEWPSDRSIPDEWFAEAESLVSSLAASGPISGFKDPRTVLLWPFWRRVFESTAGVEVVPVLLVRSPHEIAMSLCTRSGGIMPYWRALDLVGVHLARMKAVAEEFGGAAAIVRFGDTHFQTDLRRLVEACGLAWDDATVDAAFDRSCVHHQPAIVSHAAQESLGRISGDAWEGLDPTINAARLAKDARQYEATMHRLLGETQKQLGVTLFDLQRHKDVVAEAGAIAHALEARAVRAESDLVDAEKAFNLAKHCVEQSEMNLARTMESLVSTQERRVSAEQLLAHTQGVLAHTENHVVQIQQSYEHAISHLAAVQNRNLELERSLARMVQHQEALSLTQEAWAADRARLAETQDRIARIQEMTIERDDQFRLALDREQKLWLETVELRKRLDRIESHAVLGAALRGRRQIKQIWLKFRHLGPSGVERTTRIDRPV